LPGRVQSNPGRRDPVSGRGHGRRGAEACCKFAKDDEGAHGRAGQRMTPDSDAHTRTPPSGGSPSARWAVVRRALRPIRRVAAWFALVDEESATRRGSDQTTEQSMNTLTERVARVAADLANEVRRLEAELGAIAERVEALHREVDDGFGARADLTIKELWKRLEFADATQATAIQRL